jgi:hypothetical protein
VEIGIAVTPSERLEEERLRALGYIKSRGSGATAPRCGGEGCRGGGGGGSVPALRRAHEVAAGSAAFHALYAALMQFPHGR